MKKILPKKLSKKAFQKMIKTAKQQELPLGDLNKLVIAPNHCQRTSKSGLKKI